MYINEPKQIVVSEPSKSADISYTFLASNIIKLGKLISALEAKAFPDFINQLGDKKLKLSEVTNAEGRELIGGRLIAKAAFIGLTEEEA